MAAEVSTTSQLVYNSFQSTARQLTIQGKLADCCQPDSAYEVKIRVYSWGCSLSNAISASHEIKQVTYPSWRQSTCIHRLSKTSVSGVGSITVLPAEREDNQGVRLLTSSKNGSTLMRIMRVHLPLLSLTEIVLVQCSFDAASMMLCHG